MGPGVPHLPRWSGRRGGRPGHGTLPRDRILHDPGPEHGRTRGTVGSQAGSMFRLVRNTFCGSHLALTSASRASAVPSAALTRSGPSSSVRKLT